MPGFKGHLQIMASDQSALFLPPLPTCGSVLPGKIVVGQQISTTTKSFQWGRSILMDFEILNKSPKTNVSKYISLVLFLKPFVSLIILHTALCDNTPARGSPQSHPIIHRASVSRLFLFFFFSFRLITAGSETKTKPVMNGSIWI